MVDDILFNDNIYVIINISTDGNIWLSCKGKINFLMENVIKIVKKIYF